MIRLGCYGSWTLRRAESRRGLEPDECYVRDPRGRPERPDVAIEVVWTPGGLDKLEVYRGLDVREVWIWQDGRLRAHLLGESGYIAVDQSPLFPEIDLFVLARLATMFPEDAIEALREHLAAAS